MANFRLRVFDVEHGACTIMQSLANARLAMIDSGHNNTTGWRPSAYIKNVIKRTELEDLFITNADQDHVSDLEGLWKSGINVHTFHRNRTVTPQQLRSIKEEQGECTNDVERYLDIHQRYIYPVPEPFDAHMDGVTVTQFNNSYPEFKETNDLSLAVFVKRGFFKMLFPGDMEKAGWLALLKQPEFVKELADTKILMASHHGRESGYCREIFDYFQPWAVVISDKPIVHATQEMVPDYRAVIRPEGVKIANVEGVRHVLTTRRDGDIDFEIQPDGTFTIRTTAAGNL